MATQRAQLLASLAGIIGDYREGMIAPITPRRVELWLNQFDQTAQRTILIEMESIFWRYYFSRARIKTCFRKFLAKIIARRPPQQVLSRVKFLNIQRIGESQRDLLTLMDEVLRQDFHMTLDQCGGNTPMAYVYLDDCIYTGSRIRYDLTEGDGAVAWIPRMAPIGCRLIIYTLGIHTEGFHYVAPIIVRAASEKRISVSFYYVQKIENERDRGSRLECLWPDDATANAGHADENIAWYVRKVLWWRKENNLPYSALTRWPGVPAREWLFSSPEARSVVESAFLKVGTRLIRPSHKNGSSIRPLGFEKIESLGFGTFFVTYRNIANNCPLALWWNVGNWEPLFPRRTNPQYPGVIG